jgi:hypothetical protein
MWIKVFPGAGEVGSEAFELFKVERRERFELHGPYRGEAEADDPLVVLVAGAGHQSSLLGPVDEADGAVVAEKQVVGGLADGRASRVGVAANGEQQLVLGGREPSLSGLLLAPALEAA